MKKYQAYIFDLDGTLLDSKTDIAHATNATIVHLGGQTLPVDVIATFVGHGVRDLIRQAIPGEKNSQKENQALKYFTDYYLAHCLDHSKLMRNARALLDELSLRGAPMAVLTNKPQIYTDVILRGLDLEKYFKIVIGSDAGYPNKPAPDATRVIIAALERSPDQILMVGDSDVDLQTARNGGIDCALALNGFSAREEILAFKKEAVLLFEDLAELFS